MNFQTMSKQRKFILIASVVGLISIFLPWLTIGAGMFGGSINGFHDTGILVFLGFLAAGIISLLGDHTKNIERTMWLVVMIAGGIAFLFTTIYIIRIAGSIGGSFGFASYGFGVWISLVASAGVLFFAWKYKTAGDTLKSGFDSLKKDIPLSMNTNSSSTTTRPSKMDELERLIELKNQGKITEQEYQEMKSKII